MKHLKLSLATFALAALAGCASNPTADIRAHAAPDAEFARYSTFGSSARRLPAESSPVEPAVTDDTITH